MENNQHNNPFHFLNSLNPAFGQALQSFVRGMVPQQPQAAERDLRRPEERRSTPDSSLQGGIPDSLPVEPHPADSVDQAVHSTNLAAASMSQMQPAPPYDSPPQYSESTSQPPHAWQTEMQTDDVEMAEASSTAHPMIAEQTFTPPSPSLEASASTMRGSRRARVDDIDDEDVRETNRQRMHSPEVLSLPQSTALPAQPPQEGLPTDHNHPHPHAPIFSRIVYSFDIMPPHTHTPSPPQSPAANTADAAQSAEERPADQAQPQDRPHRPMHFPMFNLSFNIPMSPASPTGPPPTATAAPGEGAPNPIPEDAVRHILEQMFGGGGGVLPVDPAFFMAGPGGIPFPHREEQDDPQRAKRLVAGLEEVPLGLVQRMERTAQGETPKCAICFDSLLEEPVSFDEPSEQPPSPEEGEQTSEDDVTESKKVVVLPCTHVFHTSCLLPWFSKPHRTTCPTCRFDIDPDSLTYTPPRPSQRARPGASQPHFHFGPPLSPDPQPQPAPQIAADDQPQPVPQPADALGQQLPPLPTGPLFSPVLALDFSIFIPAPHHHHQHQQPQQQQQQQPQPQPQPGPAGPLPGFTQLEEQAARGLLERLFGGTVRQPADAQGVQQPEPTPAAEPAGAQPQPQPQPQPTGHGARGPDGPRTRLPTFQEMFAPMPGPLPGHMPHFHFHPPPVMPTPPPPAPADPAPVAAELPRPQTRPRPSEKPQWSIPAPPGPTLRQRVERKEREMGLRCSDVSCGLGPSDEDPVPVVDPTEVRRIAIHQQGSGPESAVCEHTFHPACLVSAERVAGWGSEDKKEEKEGDEQVEVSCPLCRAVGYISRTDWDEGACALA